MLFLSNYKVILLIFFRNNALTPGIMLLLTLRLYATGSMLVVAGDFCGVHKSTACKVVRKVSRAIASLRLQFIHFPETNQNILKTRQGFYDIARFPRCIGAIDCTHVRIQSPGGEEPELFRNRKDFFSINVQTVCDSNLKIQDIVARWPGATHDSTIFNNSRVRAKFENGEMGDSLLLGDSGYPIKRYLITPLANTNTPAENLFNESVIRTRNPVERSYGVWKRRFPILALGIKLKLNRIEAVIVSTAVLHNIACLMKEEVPSVNEDIEAQINILNNIEPNNLQRLPGGENNLTRNVLIHDYFQRLL